MNNRREKTKLNEGIVDQNFAVDDSDGGHAVKENVVNVKTLERCFNEKIDTEMGNIVDTVQDRIHGRRQILTAIDSIITPKVELAIRSMKASSGRDAASVMANSERGEHVGITVRLENVSERNNTL